MERRASKIILNVYQSTVIEKEDDSRQSLDEIRRFYNKKFDEGHDVHRNLASAETQQTGRKPIRIWSNGDNIQPFLGFRGRERSQESRSDGAAEVLDREDNRD